MANNLEKALDYLDKTQLGHGGFTSLSSAKKDDFSKNIEYLSGFGPSLILSSLSAVDNKKSILIRNRLAKWLAKQKGPHGSYNYWAIGAKERDTLPYPDDLDDTFCALIGLHLHDPANTDGTMLAQAVNILIATESQPGGPYRTWLVPKTVDKAWLDIDLAVNANIAYFLSLAAEPLPNLDELMHEAILSKKIISPYYPDEFPIIYYMSRALSGTKNPILAKHIMSLRNKNGDWGTPMHTALMISSLVKLGVDTNLNKSKEYLLRTQHEDGSWPAEAFCLDPAIDGQQYYSGSPALTTALCVEALRHVETKSHINPSAMSSEDERRDFVYSEVVKTSVDNFRSLSPEMNDNMTGIMEFFAGCDTGKDAILLPYYFYSSLKKPSKFDHNFIINLGLANLYGWLAYTIYDDFLDDEGKPNQLPGACVSLRRSLQMFMRVSDGNVEFMRLVDAMFDVIDTANNWELSNCRFDVEDGRITLGKLPNFDGLDKLADKSIGHALTPIAILVRQGYSPRGSEASSVLLAIRHYLIARQLNDDLHDWQEDLERGHITFVVAQILGAMKLRQKKLNIKRSMPSMQRQFWHETVLDVCQVVDRHVSASRKALSSCTALKKGNVIDLLLDEIDRINAGTRDTVNDAKDFIKAYAGKRYVIK